MFGRLKEQPSPQSLVGASTAPSAAAAGDAGSSGPPERLILIAFTILTLAASALVLHRAAEKDAHDPLQKARRGEIQGLGQLSLLRADNLRKALAKVAASRYPLVVTLRVAATRVDVTARDKDGFRKLLSINAALKMSVSDDNVTTDRALPVSRIDPTAPERMIQAVTERTHMSANAVDYLFTTAQNDKDNAWYMSLNQGPARVRQWVATRDGTDLRHPGDASRAQAAAAARLQRAVHAQVVRSQRLAKCLSTASTAAAATRCERRFLP